MTQEERLEEVLKRTGIPVQHYEYKGTKPEYIVYNEEVEQPTNYADNHPQNRITWWQTHLFTPKESDFRKLKQDMQKFLKDAGFKVTEVKTLYEHETTTIHVVICCHMGEREE